VLLLNAEEMQAIADQLFVGNKLASGELRSSDGLRIDLRNIKSPIVVFCSWGDDITPPQQLWTGSSTSTTTRTRSSQPVRRSSIALHQSIGHLGIFVSGKVATKEHGEFAQSMDMIDLMPPGLYEAVITGVDDTVGTPGAGAGQLPVQPRDPDARGYSCPRGKQPEDDLRFATAARVSEINQGLYRTLMSPAAAHGG